MPDVLPTINNEPPQGIQALLDTVYLWNPDVANDLIEKINELLVQLEGVSGTIPPYSTLEAPIKQYTPCYNGDNVYVAARDLDTIPTEMVLSEWILIATKAPVLQAGTGISIDGNEISVTSDISSGASAGATAVQPGDLGTAAYAATTDFATATQGGKADTALQPNNVVDNLNSESSTDVLSANQGRVLESQIVALEGRGHYLSSWNCSTGLAGTNPPSSPYVYKAGDYFIVSTVGSTNYKPSGTQYVTGVASPVVETEDVAVNDTYTFDGTNWSLLKTSKVDALPPQTGNAGKFLTTDGTDASWASVTTYSQFPQSWDIAHTTKDFCDDINADASAKEGMAYLGEVTFTDMPNSIGNAECVVEIMMENPSSKTITLTLTSGNVAPYMWKYTYWNNGTNVSGWQTWLQNNATGSDSVVVGRSDTSNHPTNTVVIGGGSGTQSAYSVAIGYNSATNTSSSTAVGASTRAVNKGVALGYAAQATQSIQMSCNTSTTASNSDANTLKVANDNGNFELMSADGTIPEARLADTTSATQGQVLTLDSNLNATWDNIDALPSQTGNAGKFLTTDGTDASWETISFPVSSVNNKTGAVTLNAADVGATLVTFRTWEANE